MMFSAKKAEEKRKDFKKKLKGSCLRFVGSFSPLVSQLIEEKGFDGLYVSGAVLSADRGWPDIGLTTMSEVIERAENLTQFSNLPSLVDGDTGFGSVVNASRMLKEMEKRGLSAVHIEDQSYPKRCGHLDNKKLISIEEMVSKIQSLVKAREDSNFLIVARTDARGVEDMDSAIKRAQAYVQAGADAIFPEALANEEEFKVFRDKVKEPLIANMTEFGKTDVIPHKVFQQIGYNMVIYPVSTFRLALKAVEEGLEVLFQDKQESLLPKMQTRKRLYQLLRYEDYKEFDKEIFNFKLKEDKWK